LLGKKHIGLGKQNRNDGRIGLCLNIRLIPLVACWLLLVFVKMCSLQRFACMTGGSVPAGVCL